MAAAEPSYSLLAYVTPHAPALGDPMEIHVSAYRGVTPVDLDDLTGTVRFYVGEKNNLSFERSGTGRYVAHVVLPLQVARVEDVNVQLYAWLGGEFQQSQIYVAPSNMPHLANAAPMLFAVLVGEGPNASMVAPGQHLVFRAWTYLNGTLDDFEVPHVSGTLWPTGIPPGSIIQGFHLKVERVSRGTYEFEWDVPTDVAISTDVWVGVELRNQTGDVGRTMAFTIDPFPATLVVTGLADDVLSIKTCAGQGDLPLANASVHLHLTFPHRYQPDSQEVTYAAPAKDFDLLTASDGCALQTLPWPEGDADEVEVFARIDAFGKSTHRDARGPRNLLDNPPTAYGPFPDGFSVELVGEPAPVDPGETAHLTFFASSNGTPYASAPVGVMAVWYGWPPTPYPVGNQTTDENGFLN